MPLIITAKDRVDVDFGDPAGDDLRTAFLQIERYTVLLEKFLGISIGPNPPNPSNPNPSTDVPIGGLLTSGGCPAAPQAIVNTTVILGTFTFRLIANHRYLFNIYGSGSISVAVPTFVNITAAFSPSGLPPGQSGFVVSTNLPPVTTTLPGTLSGILSPTTNTNVTLTVRGQASGTTGSWNIAAGAVQFSVVRVA